jgi:hypothetical protein
VKNVRTQRLEDATHLHREKVSTNEVAPGYATIRSFGLEQPKP